MKRLKTFIAKILRRLLPFKYYKLVANGFIIVPSYYKSIIEDAERYMNLSLQDSPEKDVLLMRKYAHILDKGLHRSDAEPGHSKSVYENLKLLIRKLSETKYGKDATYIWAESKLEKYEMLQRDPKSFEPFRGDPVTSQISYEDLFLLIKQRRSNRVFKPQQISEVVIRQLKEVVNWSASSCNKQPIQLFVTNNPELSKKCLACCKGGTGFSDYIPSFWVFTADCRGYVWPTELYLPVLDTSLGIQNVFLTAYTMNISGSILTWAQKSEQEEILLREYLNIPREYIIVCCAVMGYAEYSYCTPQRKSIV